MEPLRISLAEVTGFVPMAIKYNGKEEIIKIRPKQLVFIDQYFKTHDINLAAERAGVKPDTARIWTGNRKFKEFMRQRWETICKIKDYQIRWLSRMIDIYEGKTPARPVEMRAGENIGKALGFLKERSVLEHSSVQELLIVQNNQTQLQPSLQTGGDRFSTDSVYIPDGGPQVGQNRIDALQIVENLPKTGSDGLVRNEIKDSSQGHSLENSTGNAPQGND